MGKQKLDRVAASGELVKFPVNPMKRPKALWVEIRDADSKPMTPAKAEFTKHLRTWQSKQRKPIKRRSDYYESQMVLYRALRAEFLLKPENAKCCVFPRRKATQIHHVRGRGRGGVGPLLLDQRYWLAVSPQGHDAIHKNPEWARGQGLLAGADWNQPGPILEA